jgi:O-succinylbenzoate synthase
LPVASHPRKTLRISKGEHMGLIDKLRQAEEQGRGAAHRGMERARETWDDAERRLRRKMRLHPRNDNAQAPLPGPTHPPVSSSTSVAAETLPNRASEEDAA